MITVSGEEALASFRSRLTGRYGLDLLRQHGGRLLVQLPVGVGKSLWIDAITTAALEGDDYDLVVVLCPTRQLIEERAPLHNPPAGIKVVNLRPRPAGRCGRQRDTEWKQFEAADLGTLGRVEICGSCPHRRRCYWPDQYGRALQQARLIYGTQVHLERSPYFLARLRAWAGARKMLTLLDEANLVGTSFEQVIPSEDLRLFLDVLRHVAQLTRRQQHVDWMEVVSMLRDASTQDLQEGNWHFPSLNRKWALAVQRAGLDRYGDQFRFLGYALHQLRFSPPESRRRDDNGDLQFSTRPWVGDCMVFSGTADREFARYRLGQDLASPFADYRFIHPETRWYNLASPIGTRQYFSRHAPQVLDFFAELIARRALEGKRVLLIAKKRFVPQCQQGLEERFRDRDLALRIVTEGWTAGLLADPCVVPLINYGVIGINLFEDFDAGYCLTGYYVNETVVNHCLQDLTRRDLRLPITIETVGNPRRRRASVANPEDRFYDLAGLVQPAREFCEDSVVVQAVGRVRPFTRPREVITFQMAQLPGVAYNQEFSTLAEARRFFEVPTRRERQQAVCAAQVLALRGAGKTQRETAALLGVSERTVRNYDRKEDRQRAI